jgi:hypothetical protein
MKAMAKRHGGHPVGILVAMGGCDTQNADGWRRLEEVGAAESEVHITPGT